ncbi:uncharacterized protein LOC124949830 [Vespa velutina]|uniref:uncharacterized protein LOC124949830 n=1 Tax=Vespa velutina TaxID=202808 RepID=UPI001FB36550|nr:uncharacterized protein LOC124949830 [Vespa velutina]
MGCAIFDEDGFWTKMDIKNMTEAEYLNEILGSKYLPMSMVLPLTTVYVAIFVSGIFGNIATCTVIAKNTSMQTSTNYYLFNLAISDLTLLILGLPNELSVFWQQYPWTLGVALCKIRAYVSEMSSYVSVLTIVAFSMERYFAICHPLRVYTMSGLKRPIRFIFAAWSIALVSAIPFAIYTKVNYVEYPPKSGNCSAESAICAILSNNMPNFPLYEISCIIFFFLPMLVILVVYTRMGLEIKRSMRHTVGPVIHSSIHGETRQVQSRKSTIRMLSVVVVMFFLCWAPFHAQRLLYVYAKDSDYYPDLNEWLYILSGCLYYFSTTVNPILYNMMSVKYREAFKQTICCKRKLRKSWTIKPPDLCRCKSSEEPHLPRFRCSMRYTFGQAKEVFRFSSNRDRVVRDRSMCNHYDEIRKIRNQDSSKSLLNNNGHPIVQERSSEESTTSKEIVKESISTASSSFTKRILFLFLFILFVNSINLFAQQQEKKETQYLRGMNISSRYALPLTNFTKFMNLDESEYLQKKLGSKHLPLQLVLPITFVYVIIFVTGVFGNIMTCIVIKKKPMMQTATNYYLFNLAISDLLLLVLGLPNELSIFWEQYPWQLGLCMCKLRAFVSEMSSYASVLTIVAFSLERYLAICHPLHLYTMSGLKRPVRFILGVWLVALIFAIPFAVYTTINYIEYPPGVISLQDISFLIIVFNFFSFFFFFFLDRRSESGRYSEDSAVCAMFLQNMPDFPLYELSCLIFFLIPMMFIMILYVRMCLRIQRNTLGRSIEGSVHGETRQAHSRKAIVRMLIAVVIMFFVCWAPFHAQRLLYVYRTSYFDDINEWLHPLSGCLYYFSTTVNPILYNVMSAKYRTAFKETLWCSSVNLSTSSDGNNSVTVYDCETGKEFRMMRVRSFRYRRSIKRYDSSEQTNILQRSLRNNEDYGRSSPTETFIDDDPSIIASIELRRSSLVVQSYNGRTKCWTTKKERASSKETHI